jgi:hypothetical protein
LSSLGRHRKGVVRRVAEVAIACVAKESSGRAAGDDSFGGGVSIAMLAIRP